eukprot:2823138-Amphidinium_carterae.1
MSDSYFSRVLSSPPVLLPSHMAAVNSETYFKAAARVVGLTEPKIEKFVDKQPGFPDDTAFVNMVKDVLGNEFALGKLAEVDDLPFEERDARMKELKSRLEGVRIRRPLEPSDSLCKRHIEMGCLGGIGFQGLGEHPRDPQLYVDHAGTFRPKQPSYLDVDLTTYLMVRFALQRRGMAFDLARIMAYVVHEEWVDELIDR